VGPPSFEKITKVTREERESDMRTSVRPRKMRRVLIAVPVLLVCVNIGGIAQSSTPDSKPTVTITIKMAESTVRMGKPIKVQLTLKNVSGHQLFLPQDMYNDLEDKVTVLDLYDKEQPKTEYHKALRGESKTMALTGNNFRLTLEVGQSVRGTVPVQNCMRFRDQASTRLKFSGSTPTAKDL